MSTKFPTIQSRVNGLQIAVPPQARGVISRFATSNGNDLVFVKPRGVIPADHQNGDNYTAPVRVESQMLDNNTPVKDLA